MAKLTAYEIEREANIARNRALLEQLDIKQAVSDLGIPASKPAKKAKPIQPAQRTKRTRTEFEAPTRTSARLRKTTADPKETPEQRKKREAELEEERAKEAERQLEEDEKARIAKRPRHGDLKLALLAEGKDAQDVSTLTQVFSSVAQLEKQIGDVEAFVYEDTDLETAAIQELREKLSGLKVVARAKVTQDRIYSAAYHPEVTKDLMFFGDKHGQVGIWDARAPTDEEADEDGDITNPEQREGGKYWRLQLHWPATSVSSVSCIKIDPIDSHNIFTSAYDCTIRSLNFTSGISREVYTTGESRHIISSFDSTPNGHEMWISDSSGGITHLDIREDSSNIRRYGLSNQKIGCVSVNPTNSNFILTASNNRLLKIWDARHLSEISLDMADTASDIGSPIPQDALTPTEFSSDTINEYVENTEACVRAEWKHHKSVSSAYWDINGRRIVSTSYDDTLRLWNFDSELFSSSSVFPSSRPFHTIDHNCQTGKWLSILKATWSPNPHAYPHFTIGNMKQSLDIYAGNGQLLTRLSSRSLITAVQAVTISHPSVVERAASGNASGRCVLWAPADAEETD